MTDLRFETDRLLIRPHEDADFPAYAAYILEPKLRRDLGLENVTDRDSAWETFQWLQAHVEFLALTDRQSGCILGHICIHPPLDQLAADPAFQGKEGRSLSFAVAKEARRKGYMEEALRALLPRLFQRGLVYVDCEVTDFNEASQALQKKLGFVNWGSMRFGDVELLIQILENPNK